MKNTMEHLVRSVISRPELERKSLAFEDCERLIEILMLVIDDELTETQKERLMLYYCDGRTMQEIGDLYNCHKSSIFRSLQHSRNQLRRALRYYEMGFNDCVAIVIDN